MTESSIQQIYVVESLQSQWEAELDFALVQLKDGLGQKLGHFGLVSLEYKDLLSISLNTFENASTNTLLSIKPIDYNDHFISFFEPEKNAKCISEKDIGKALITYSDKFGYCIVGLIIGIKTGLYFNNAKVDTIANWQKGIAIKDLQLFQPMFDKMQEIKVQLLSKLQKGILYIIRLSRSIIAISTIDKQIILYDTSKSKILKIFNNDHMSRTLICYENLLACTSEKVIIIIDWIQQKIAQTIICAQNPNSIVFLSKEQIAVGDFFGSIYIFEFDVEQNKSKLIRSIDNSEDQQLGHIGKINQILKIKENIILVASNFGQIKLWNWNEKQPLASLSYHPNNQNIKYLNIYSNNLLISTTSCGIINIYDSNTQKVVQTINNQAPIDCLIQLHNHKEIMFTCQNILKVLSLENFQVSEVFMMKQRIKSVCQLTSSFFIVGDEQGLLKSLTLLPSQNIKNQLNKIKQKFDEMYPLKKGSNLSREDYKTQQNSLLLPRDEFEGKQSIHSLQPQSNVSWSQLIKDKIQNNKENTPSRLASLFPVEQENIVYYSHSETPQITSFKQLKEKSLECLSLNDKNIQQHLQHSKSALLRSEVENQPPNQTPQSSKLFNPSHPMLLLTLGQQENSIKTSDEEDKLQQIQNQSIDADNQSLTNNNSDNKNSIYDNKLKEHDHNCLINQNDDNSKTNQNIYGNNSNGKSSIDRSNGGSGSQSRGNLKSLKQFKNLQASILQDKENQIVVHEDAKNSTLLQNQNKGSKNFSINSDLPSGINSQCMGQSYQSQVSEWNKDQGIQGYLNKSTRNQHCQDSAILKEIKLQQEEKSSVVNVLALYSKQIQAQNVKIAQLQEQIQEQNKCKAENSQLKDNILKQSKVIEQLQNKCQTKENELNQKEQQLLEMIKQIEFIKSKDSQEIIKLKLELKKKEQIITDLELQQASTM